MLWPNVARLAIAFRKTGCAVGAVAVDGHPVHRMRSPDRTFCYRPTAPRDSLRQAIETFQPELIVPCDDRIVSHLHWLYGETARRGEDVASFSLAALLRTSLGQPACHASLRHRPFLQSLKNLPDVHIPRIDPIESRRQLHDWVGKHGLPAVLKLDGSWGGRDVILMRSAAEVTPALLKMRLRQSVLMRVKRLIINGDVEQMFSAENSSVASVSVQSFVPGRLANCAIACWRGEVLAATAVEVIRNRSAFASATAVRQVAGTAMIAAARSIAGHLQLSGLCGFDFVLDDKAKLPWLIEINPRATQIDHLLAGGAKPELPMALRCALTAGNIGNQAAAEPLGDIALFPAEWQRDPKSALLSSAFHDVPTEEPELLRYYRYASEASVQLAKRVHANPRTRSQLALDRLVSMIYSDKPSL